jgi:hypothetical protein
VVFGCCLTSVPYSIVDAKSSNIRKIYKDHIEKLKDAPTERTFQRWHENGCKFIILVAGGSFFILIIIAGLEIRWKITMMRFEIIRQVARMLRQPGTSGESAFDTLPSSSDRNPHRHT